MAATKSPPPEQHTLPSQSSKKIKNQERKRTRHNSELDRFNSFTWNPSVTGNDEDPFSSLLVGSDELDGDHYNRAMGLIGFCQENAKKSWFKRNAESIELVVENDGSEEERVNNYKQKRVSSMHLKKLQQAGISPLLQHQFEELARQKLGDSRIVGENKRRKLMVFGQDCVEPLQALRTANDEMMDMKEITDKRRNVVGLRKKKKRGEETLARPAKKAEETTD